METGLKDKVVIVTGATANIGSGRIINIGSTAGFIGDRLMAVYSAAKGGVHAFTRVLALAVYLASEQAAFVTGHVLQVDGAVGLV